MEANERLLHDQARWILLALINALDKHPSLYDARKRDALLKIALIFQRLRHPWESEHILKIASHLPAPSTAAAPEKPSDLLAKSFPATSEMMRRVISKIYAKTFGSEDVPLELSITPLQRAVQLRNGDVAVSVLSRGWKNSLSVNQQAFQDTEFWNCGNEALVQQKTEVDARDFRSRTPLFLAASFGHDQCSFALLHDGQADPNKRDSCMHTILEVAAKGGHTQIVMQLVTAGAFINPEIAGCASSPLQAAIESESLNLEIVHYLLDRGANIYTRRLSDSKNAIEIAEAKGFLPLVQVMRVRHLNQRPSLFDFGVLNFEQHQDAEDCTSTSSGQ